jgi:hypothetical protein
MYVVVLLIRNDLFYDLNLKFFKLPPKGSSDLENEKRKQKNEQDCRENRNRVAEFF